MTDSTDASARASTPHVREISVPANTESTVVLDPCTNGNPCVVCWLRKRVADDPETSYQGFRTGELELNILGVRRRDSVTDRFDDFMVVFFKLVAPEHKPIFDRVIEQDLRDNWKTIYGKSSQFTKLVPCTKDGASWVVSIYRLSTDPGLTDLPLEKAAKKKKASEELVKKKQAAIDAIDKELEQLKELAKAKQELHDQMADDPPSDPKVKPRKGTQKPPKAQALADAKNAQTKVSKKEVDRAKLEAELANLKEKDAANGAALASEQENAKSQPALAVLGDGTEGGLAVGRGMMACGAYTNKFLFYIHHGSKDSPGHFPKGHVALTVDTTLGCRFYSVSLVKSASWDSADQKETVKHVEVKVGDKTESRPVVAGLFVGGQKPGEKFANQTATLVVTQTEAQKATKTRDVSLEVNGAKRSLADGDVLLLRASVSGTNLHRGHNAKVAASGDEVEEGRDGGKWVKDFSWGCQVNPDFPAFNQFIRLAAIGKRWTCAKAKAVTPGCDRLVAADGEELGKGEQALLDSFGRRYIAQATLTKLPQGNLAAKKAEVAALEKKKLEADQKKVGTFTADDEAKLTKARADRDALQAAAELKDDIKNEDAKVNPKAAISKAKESIIKADEKIAGLKSDNAKRKTPKSDAELAPDLKPFEDKKAKAILERDAAQKQLDELEKKETLKKDALAARRKFLNERTRFFRGDFLRECDLHAGGSGVRCEEKFTYVLIELDDAGCDELHRRFKEGRNQSWNGEIVLPG